MDQPVERPAGPPISTVLGILLAGVVVLVLGLWLGRNGIGGSADVQAPRLTLVEPDSNALLTSPARIVFETNRLAKAPEGWRAGRFHLHAVVDGTELMPAAADIQRLGATRFAWRLPNLVPGPHRIQLRWSDPTHAPVAEGATPEIPFVVGGGDAVGTEIPGAMDHSIH